MGIRARSIIAPALVCGVLGCADSRPSRVEQHEEALAAGQAPSGGDKDTAPPAPLPPGVVAGQPIAGQRVEPTALPEVATQRTPEQRLARWAKHADAIAVFDAAPGRAFLTNPMDETSIATTFELDVKRTLRGTPPATITQAGGQLGSLAVDTLHDGRIAAGTTYVGFFTSKQRWKLMAAIPVTNGTFVVSGKPYSIDDLAAQYGGE